MNRGNKKITLDLEIVKEEPQQQEEAEGEDEMCSSEEVLMETRERNIELEPEHFFIKEEIEIEEMELRQDIGETDEYGHEMSDCKQSLYIEDEAESKFTTVKSDKKHKSTTMVRDFMCTACNYATKKPIEFTIHWLSHEEQSYTNTNGVILCQISDCFYVSPNQEDLLKHIASQHLYRYRCDFCYYMTYWKNDFNQHRNTHYTYQCVKCNLQSTKLFFVQDHAETPFKCKICNYASYHWFPYKQHINWHNYPPDSIVECGFCGFTTGDQALLEMHEVVHCTKFILCKMCRFTGMNIAELAQHCKDTHATTLEALDKLHKCKFCTCKFIGLGSKEKHEELHLKSGVSLKCCSNSTTVQCPYCEHLEKQRDDMNLHILSNHAAALELDGFRFEGTSDDIALVFQDLEAHDMDVKREAEQEANTEDAIKHQEKRVFNEETVEDEGNEHLEETHVNKTRQIIWRCPICPHLSKGKHDFSRHLMTEHDMSYTEAKSKSELTFRCAICQFATTDKGSYDSHLSLHRTPKAEIMPAEQQLETKAPGYTCSFCYYVTPSKEDYDLHCEQHTIFKCTKCTFESTKRLFVEDHIENPWGCAKCGFKTHHWLPMKSHSFSHNNQTSTLLKCTDCDFETKRPIVLKNHWLIHSSELLRCKICLFKTRRQNSLQIHYAEFHNGIPLDDGSVSSNNRPYECDLCACKFMQQVYLDKHRTLHGDNGPFRLRCSQCHQSKTMSETIEKKTNMKEGDKPNSWSECPYCSYEDDVRYRMIEHLSHIHQKQLEIEGYRFSDDENKDRIPHTATGIENPATEMMSNTPVAQMQDITRPDNTSEDEENCEETVYTEQNENMELVTQENTMMSRNVPEDKQYLDPSTGFILDQEPEYIHSQGNEILTDREQQKIEAEKDVIIKHEEETESDDNAFQTTSMVEEEEDINSIHRPVEQVIVKVEPKSLPEQESPKYLTSQDNTVCSNSGSMQQHQDQTQIKQKPSLTSDLHLVPRYSETDSRWHCPVCPYIAMRNHFVKKHIDQKHSIHRPVEQIIIKVEPTSLPEQESPKYLTSQDNTVCSNSGSMQQHQDQTQIKQKLSLTSGLQLVPRYSETGSRWHCPVCPYVVTRKHFVDQHIDQKHLGGKKVTWYCKICHSRTKTEKSLQQHVAFIHKVEYCRNSASEEIPCKQPGCDFKAATVDDLSMHMARHLQTSIREVMVYKCDRCSFRSVSKTIFRKHTKSCNDPLWFYCYNCDYRSESKTGMLRHIESKHQYRYIYQKGYECRKCGYSSREKSWRRNHHAQCGTKVKVNK